MSKLPRSYEVLVQRSDLKGMKKVRLKTGRSKFTRVEAQRIVAKLISKGKNARSRRVLVPKNKAEILISTWLRGDLDFDRRLMIALAKAAQESKTVLYVNYGKRSYEEQLALWNKYGPPRAARPGTSRHETGFAADVVTLRTRRNVGEIKGIRVALKKHGLCLPVPNEPWHVERGNTWRS